MPRVTKDAKERMRQLRREDPKRWTYRRLSVEFGCSYVTVSKAVGCAAWIEAEYQKKLGERRSNGFGHTISMNDETFFQRWADRPKRPAVLPRKVPGSSIEAPSRERLMAGR